MLLVVVSHLGLAGHYFNIAAVNLGHRSLISITDGMAAYGVVVFFVISGFLITSLSLRRYSKLNQINQSEFWWFRFSRIMPMLILCICIIIVFNLYNLPGFTVASAGLLIKGISSVLAFRFNEIMGIALPGSWNPLWSLSVEEMFYFVFPVACILFTGSGSIVWIFCTTFSTIIYLKYSDVLTPFSTLYNVDYLALGCLIAILKPQRLADFYSGIIKYLLSIGLLALGLGLVVIAIIMGDPFKSYGYGILCAIGASIILISSQIYPVTSRRLYLLFPITLLGVVSYEAYLIHLPLNQFLFLIGVQYSRLHVLIIIIVAALLHLYYSEPINKCLRNWRKFREEGINPVRKFLRHALPFVLSIIILPLFYYSLDFKSITIRFINIAKLEEQVSEPIAVLGHHEYGDMIFLKHLDRGYLQFGLDHWGSPLILSTKFTESEMKQFPIKVIFGLDYTKIIQNEKVLLLSKNAPYDHRSAIVLGINKQGFSSAITKMLSEIEISK